MKNSFRRWINNIKLQRKFFAILLLGLTLMFVGTLATSRLTDRAHNDALYKSTMQLLNLFSQNIQSDLDKVAEGSFNILGDNVIQERLSDLRRSQYLSTAWLKNSHSLSERVNSIELPNGVIGFRMRANENGYYSKGMTGPYISDSLFVEHAEAVREAQGREIWLADENNPGTLLLMRDVREIENLTLNSIAIIAMQVDLKKIVDYRCQILADMDMPLQCAIDFKGTRVYTTQNSIPLLEYPMDGFALIEQEDKVLFCVRYSPEGTDWVYTAAMPYEGITSSIRWASGLAMFVAVAAMTVAFVLGSILMASILRHVEALLKKYDAFAHGLWNPIESEDLYRERHDEIGELHRQFDHMAAEHQHMIDENYIKQQLLLEAQLRQLRAQIQPHFLYNTLESIYCLALESGDERIATMTGSLGRMLRATLKDPRDIITIEDDLKIAREYLNIQLIRYSDNLCASFEIDDEFLNAPIPAMTIQPLVENAVHHAAEEMIDVCTIRVYCQQIGKYVDLIVEDDGPGMAEDMLEKLERGEVQPEGLGIGLRNIHTRLQLAFRNNGCGLRICRKDGKTQVIVRTLREREDA